MRKRLSCELLEGAFVITKGHILVCCINSIVLAEYSGGHIPVDEIMQTRAKMRNALENNIPCACSGCPGLQWKVWPDDDEKYLITHKLGLSLDSPCNIHCCYCCQTNLKSFYSNDLLEITNEIITKDLISPNALIAHSSGEPIMRRDFSLWIDAILHNTKNNVLIYSNGTMFSNSLNEAMRKGRASLCVSLDCCDMETYRKIKKRNLFNVVLKNLKQYQSERIILKYILMPENSHEAPSAFLNLAESLGISTISLMLDYHRLPLAPAEMDKFCAMLNEAEKRQIAIAEIDRFGVWGGYSIIHRYFHQRTPRLAYDAKARLDYHQSGSEDFNHYQLPSWPVLLTDNTVFASELQFLLTGKEPTFEEKKGLGKCVAASPSRFHYALDIYEKMRGVAVFVLCRTDRLRPILEGVHDNFGTSVYH